MNTAQKISRAAGRIRSSDIRDLLQYAQQPGMISMAGGLPAAELFDQAGIQASTQQVLREHHMIALQYGMTEGQPALRQELASLMAQRGCPTDAQDILVTTGSQQALDLIVRTLIDEGDCVVLERPSYLAAIQVLQLAGARMLTLPGDAQGARIDLLPELVGAQRPKLIYVVSNFANPSGACLSLERRKLLLQWAVANQVMVIEDDPYGDLRYRGERLPSLLELARGIPGAESCCGYISTLSKAIAPGLRLGWAVLPPLLRASAVKVKQSMDLHTSSFTQEIAAHYLASGRLAEHLTKVRAAYSSRGEALAQALCVTFGDEIEFNRPAGGMFLWGRFKSGIDTRKLLDIARLEGVIFVPGDTFYADSPDHSSLRLSFVTCTEDQLREGVKRLASAYAEINLDNAELRPLRNSTSFSG